MLDELNVSNIALIEDAQIAFASGLTVLTGETGAGKTALLSALSLVQGKRADCAIVRDGASEALVQARLVGSAEHILKRRLSAKGRSRCTVDGEMATVGELANAASSLHVHGQRDQGRLLDAAVQTAYLDAFADEGGEALRAYRNAREAYLEALHEQEAFAAARDSAARELEFMRYTLAEIEKVKPMRGEYEELEEELPRLQHGEQLAAALHGAASALQDDGGALDALGTALRALEREAGIDSELDGFAQRLSALDSELSDLTRDLHSYAQDFRYEPQRLQEVLTRLDELSALKRRFGPGMEGVFDNWEKAALAVETAQASPEREQELERRLAAAQDRYRQRAHELSDVRRQHAKSFTSQLEAAVAELAMKDAGFSFSFEELPFERWTQDGSERIELMYRPAPASQLRPLSRIASGGELSRISLALECLYRTGTGSDDAPTLVFDEIDQGVGGATGSAVARRLKQLSEHVQVVVVTHLPQVAALADVHYLVEKDVTPDGLAATTVRRVDGDERVAEIARMLAGTLDDTALEHARVLLDQKG